MKTLNIGLIGSGFMGKGHSMAYNLLPQKITASKITQSVGKMLSIIQKLTL
jgi:hypothetical protein